MDRPRNASQQENSEKCKIGFADCTFGKQMSLEEREEGEGKNEKKRRRSRRRGTQESLGPRSPMKICASFCAAYYLSVVITITPGTQVDSLLIASAKAKASTTATSCTTGGFLLPFLLFFLLSFHSASLLLSLTRLHLHHFSSSRHKSLIVLL